MRELTPNQSPFPSTPGNNPASLADITHLAGIDEMAAVGPQFQDGYENYSPQGPENMLMALRSRFPFLPIIPYPSAVIAVNLAAGVPKDVNFGSGMSMAMLSGDAPYWACAQGGAAVPAPGEDVGGNSASKSIYRPDGLFLFIGGRSGLSLVSTAGANVSISLWASNELPSG